ncbi:hypothetical protein CALCODRAFT_489225 [Calocera cornea HHB12733]|uniref:Uncharacterized protein n=1 Tax=Calocera cornea HHB12733 TaxID=1353952 RepID=A0A165K6G7_9BASI|nr:hypothetical protein CALCODRAFT_489225 [Calocera cornea HHB12733]
MANRPPAVPLAPSESRVSNNRSLDHSTPLTAHTSTHRSPDHSTRAIATELRASSDRSPTHASRTPATHPETDIPANHIGAAPGASPGASTAPDLAAAVTTVARNLHALSSAALSANPNHTQVDLAVIRRQLDALRDQCTRVVCHTTEDTTKTELYLDLVATARVSLENVPAGATTVDEATRWAQDLTATADILLEMAGAGHMATDGIARTEPVYARSQGGNARNDEAQPPPYNPAWFVDFAQRRRSTIRSTEVNYVQSSGANISRPREVNIVRSGGVNVSPSSKADAAEPTAGDMCIGGLFLIIVFVVIGAVGWKGCMLLRGWVGS